MPSEPNSPQPQFTNRVEGDLYAINEFIYQDSPQAARRIIERIRELCFLLAEQPYMGVSRPEFGHADLRSFVVRNTPYMIFYYPRDYGVEIAHIRHGSQDLTNLFNE